MGCGSSNAKRDRGEEEEEGATLYIYPGSAPCRAILFVVEGANIPINIKLVDIMKEEQMQDWFVKINPAHTVPVLVDGKERICESRSIMTFLMDKYAPNNRLYPSVENPERRKMVDNMLEFDKSNVYKHITNYIYPQVLKKEPPNPAKEIEVKRTLKELDQNLADQPYAAGTNVTIADYTICANISLLELKDYDYSSWENVRKWQDKMRELPYYCSVQKGLEDWKVLIKKGGKSHGSNEQMGDKAKDGSKTEVIENNS